MKVNRARLAARPTGMRLAGMEATHPLPVALAPRPVQGVAAAPKNDVQCMDTPAALRGVCEELRAADVVGLDVETALDFGTLCLVQVATRTRTFLIERLAVGDLKPNVDVLRGPVSLKVIHNARFERRVLPAIGIAFDGVFDTLEVLRCARGTEALGGHSLAMVCERELGIVLDKASQTANWSRRPLDADQLNYSALDAEVLLALRERFKDVGGAPDAGGGN